MGGLWLNCRTCSSRDIRLSAEQRLQAIERRLERDPVLKKQYHDFMREYEDLGHMEPVTFQEVKDTYYLPHHPVFKETSSTKKDSSCI
jgi:hypothetical protein